MRTVAAVFAFGCALAARAPAQVGLPPVRLPPLPAPLAAPVGQSLSDEFSTAPANTLGLRRTTAQRLIRNNRQQMEADPNGQPILRAELVGLNLSESALAQIASAGFTVVTRQSLPGIDTELFVLRAPSAMSTRRALQRLRELEPDCDFDYDHLYADSASGPLQGAISPEAAATAAPGEPSALRVGLIDGGVQRTHVVFHANAVTLWGCDGRSVPSVHGTEVASLLVGESAPFRGAAAGGSLYAADVYCGVPTGGATDAIAAAFGWMSSQRIAVINISLVGPDNLVLRQVVRQMVAHGHLVVAAVGNDGPAAPPLYPAAYPGVIGVTAVDVRRRALLEAERGPQVSFAAPGADMAAATLPEGYQAVRGTSFAAPIVAGLLAARLSDPDLDGAQRAVNSLAQDAIHLGSAARDTTFGLGLVGVNVQTALGLVKAVRPIAP
jgi:hypothetical protein